MEVPSEAPHPEVALAVPSVEQVDQPLVALPWAVEV